MVDNNLLGIQGMTWSVLQILATGWITLGKSIYTDHVLALVRDLTPIRLAGDLFAFFVHLFIQANYSMLAILEATKGNTHLDLPTYIDGN